MDEQHNNELLAGIDAFDGLDEAQLAILGDHFRRHTFSEGEVLIREGEQVKALSIITRGTVEVVQFSMVLIVFLQLPDVVRSGRLTRSDGLLTILSDRHSRFGDFLGRAIDLLSAVLMVLIAVTMWPEFTEAWETNDFFGTPGIFTAPWWPVKLVIFLSAVLCSLLWFCKVFTSSRSRNEAVGNEQ